MSKCKGCGKLLQNTNKEKLGYTPDLKNKLCERCFKIKNYNFHDNNENIMSNEEIISTINKKNACTLFLCDILSINKSNIDIYNKINNPKVFVVTKIDVLPNNIDFEVYRENLKRNYKLNDVIFASSKTKTVESTINKYFEKYDKIVMAGPTSSGKSSLINFLFNEDLTVSHYKNTTLEFINLKYEGTTVIDAPGFSIPKMDNPLRLNSPLKMKTMQVKKGFEVSINKLRFYAENDMSITTYFPKDIIISTRKVKGTYKNKLELKDKTDLVIDNLGFVYFKEKNTIYINELENVDLRESLVAKR